MVAAPHAPTASTSFEQNLPNQVARQLAESPVWLSALRQAGFTRFERLGLPTHRQEAWKTIPLRNLVHTAFQPAVQTGISPDLVKQHQVSETAIRLVFVNGHFAPEHSQLNPTPGLTVTNLKAALQTHGELIQQQLSAYCNEESDPFVALNTALFEDGAFILATGTDTPLVQLLCISTEEELAHQAHLRHVFVVEEGARLQLMVQAIGTSKTAYFNNSVQSFYLAPQAKASCTVVFNEGPEAWHLAGTQTSLHEESYLQLNTVTLAGQTIRHSVRTLLQAEEASCQLNGLDVLKGQTEVYHHTVTEHWQSNAKSEQYYKGILDGHSKSEFNGLVFVAQGADGTNSAQLNKTLLLSENAKVFTRPQLQINADDVKCAHGATVGQLEPEQLFYMASRGLESGLAQSLLTYGFAEEMIHRIKSREIRKYLNCWTIRNLHSQNTLKELTE